MVLLVYLLTQNITCIFRNLVLIFVHGCKNLFCTKIHCVWQAAPGDRTPSRREATLLHWAVLLVQQGYIQLFQCFSFLTRLAHWPFSTKKRVLFLNYLVPVSPRCLALLFQLGELSTTYFTSWAAGFITWAPWGQLPVPAPQGPARAAQVCPGLGAGVVRAAGSDQPWCWRLLWAWPAKVRCLKTIDVLNLCFWNKAFEPEVAEVRSEC